MKSSELEESDAALRFGPLRSSFGFRLHLSSHPPLCIKCVWTSSTWCSASLQLASVRHFTAYSIVFPKRYGELDRIPHGISPARRSIFISRYISCFNSRIAVTTESTNSYGSFGCFRGEDLRAWRWLRHQRTNWEEGMQIM